MIAGAGVVRSYKALGSRGYSSAEEIMQNCQEDEVCHKAIEPWAELLGTFLRDASLAYNMQRIVLLGSVIEKNVLVLERHIQLISDQLKGTYGHIIDNVPIEVITLRHTALTGCFHFATEL